MKNLSILIIFTMTYIFSSCNNTIKLSEIINIKTTRDSLDIDYHIVSANVLKIDQQQIKEKIYAKYPDIKKNYIDRIAIKTVKKTESLKKEFFGIKINREKKFIYVQITMNYEKSKKDQARQIIKYSKALIIDELIKLDLKIENE